MPATVVAGVWVELARSWPSHRSRSLTTLMSREPELPAPLLIADPVPTLPEFRALVRHRCVSNAIVLLWSRSITRSYLESRIDASRTATDTPTTPVFIRRMAEPERNLAAL